MRVRTAALLVLFAAAAPVAAQDRDEYVLLAAARTGTMEDEVNDVADDGYRVLAASRSEDSEVVVVMRRARGDYRYKLIATIRTGTLEKEINDAAEQGYRVVPGAVTTKRLAGAGMRAMRNDNPGEGELLVLMEKGPGRPSNSRYQVLATNRTGTLQKEISQASERGYDLVALVSRREHLAIMERAGN